MIGRVLAALLALIAVVSVLLLWNDGDGDEAATAPSAMNAAPAPEAEPDNTMAPADGGEAGVSAGDETEEAIALLLADAADRRETALPAPSVDPDPAPPADAEPDAERPWHPLFHRRGLQVEGWWRHRRSEQDEAVIELRLRAVRSLSGCTLELRPRHPAQARLDPAAFHFDELQARVLVERRSRLSGGGADFDLVATLSAAADGAVRRQVGLMRAGRREPSRPGELLVTPEGERVILLEGEAR